MRLVARKPLLKGTLRGFAVVELLIGLFIQDARVLVGRRGAAWAGLPSKPRLADGRHKLDEGSSR
jgi:hypothetical protein